ncbi:MAG: response regulator transcription factor [Propionibacteriaceae bacterium]|jgi:DNA-binding response OmpR family regulator|nr:response regulator transcription factor [Propionibacteriaceae bacterium]
MATVLLITPSTAADPFPPLTLLPHTIAIKSPRDQVLTESAGADVILIDARRDLGAAKNLCHMFATAGVGIPRLIILSEGGLATYSGAWECDDFLAESASPAEIETRLRLATSPQEGATTRVTAGGVVIDEAAYSVWLDDNPLDLTYTEFELLKFLAAHPGRVFSREQLLDEVWGYDYYGGTRTVDVHVRRLRAKLGPEHEALIGTVRNVGYRFTVR